MFCAKRHTAPRKSIKFGVLLPVVGAGSLGRRLRADAPPAEADYHRDPARMVEAYRRVEAASVSDAGEQLLHVVDGGVRDLPQLKKTGLPVYATGTAPSTSVTHYRFGGIDVSGTRVYPNDMIVADRDGVVVVPRMQAAKVFILGTEARLQRAQHGSLHRENSFDR
jgi:Aldolase/RraA